MASHITASIPPDNPHHNIVNFKRDTSLDNQFECMTTLLQKANKASAKLNKLVQSNTSTAHEDVLSWTISTFWILTNYLAHDTISTITTFQLDTQALKDTDLFTKLELDLMTLNFILHQHIELSKLMTSFIRIISAKQLPHHMSQLQRQMDFILDMTENLNSATMHSIQQFHCAIGSTPLGQQFSQHASKLTINHGMMARLMKSFKSILISDPVVKVNRYLHSETGKNVIKWACDAMKLFTPAVIPDTCELLFSQLLEKCPLPLDYSNEAIRSGMVSNPLREFGTIARAKDTPKAASRQLTL